MQPDMNLRTRRALSYDQTEPVSKARLRPVLDYGIAALTVGLALLLQVAFVTLFGGGPNSSPFLVFFVAVMVAAWFGGLWPGLSATALSALLSKYFFLFPQYSLQIASPAQSLRLAVFILEGALISALVGTMYSARRRAEANAEALRRSEQQFRTLVEQIPAATYTQQLAEPDSSKTNPTLYASPQIEAQSGYPPEAFVEAPQLWIKLLHPDDRERVLAEDKRTDETGEPFRMEYRQIARDGRVVWIRDEAVLVRDEHGRPRFWQGVMYDITDGKRTEKALQESEQQFRAIFEQSVVGMVQVELDGGWLRFNDRFCEILGYTRQELLRRDFRDMLLPEDLV